ncbi:MAG: VOC family protein [Flavobacteriales bacterium]|nr:VOC family protein [Flavobacteriales bacterium]
MDNKSNALNWFEIAVNDLARAQKFYEAVFNISMEAMDMPGMQMRNFPADSMNGKAGGALVKSDMHKPSATGSVIYLNGNPDLSDALSRVEKAGGKVIMPKTEISPEIGHMAFFTDTEGNTVAMHSQS